MEALTVTDIKRKCVGEDITHIHRASLLSLASEFHKYQNIRFHVYEILTLLLWLLSLSQC